MSAEPIPLRDAGHVRGCRCWECGAAYATAAAFEAAARNVADRMVSPPPPALLLRLPDAARQLGIGESKLRELEKAGLIEFLRIDGSVVIDYDELVAFRDRLRRDKRVRS